MIKKLQRKFVTIAMLSLSVVIIILIAVINGVNLFQMNQKADGFLTLLSNNDGQFPQADKQPHRKPGNIPPAGGIQVTPETPFETRYFTIKADENDAIFQIDTGHIAAISSTQAQQYAEKVLTSGHTKGYSGVYKYMLTQQEYGQLLVFIDCSNMLQTNLSFLLVSCGVALGGLLVVFLLVSVLSRRAIRPIIENMEKQKQFITDAGHEIKTPLAIISANTEVLELNGGINEWTKSIKNQIGRLSQLVQNLLSLSKWDEDHPALVFVPFSLSDAVLETAQPFETLAQTQGKTFYLDVQQGLFYNGDEVSIRQLVSILADNAVKYSSEQGDIQVKLYKNGKLAQLQLKNSCDNLENNDIEKWFDRFYRPDSSRSRESGGYGIGLSVAKAIVQAHKGKIMATKGKGTICFTVSLPLL